MVQGGSESRNGHDPKAEAGAAGEGCSAAESLSGAGPEEVRLLEEVEFHYLMRG